jgi:hypothetical protein
MIGTRARARANTTAASPMRSFDPHAVGTYECRAWETYYQHQWAAFLGASVGMVRSAFRMSWRRTLVGASHEVHSRTTTRTPPAG